MKEGLLRDPRVDPQVGDVVRKYGGRYTREVVLVRGSKVYYRGCPTCVTLPCSLRLWQHWAQDADPPSEDLPCPATSTTTS